jgi:hypothetical protein
VKDVGRKGRRKDAEADETPRGQAAMPGDEASRANLWAEFQERFPNLAAEMEESHPVVRVDGVRWQETGRTKASQTSRRGKFAKYEPDIVDFVRRCSTAEEALEIIAFLEQRREIDPDYAKALRHQLLTRGLRSFGPQKTWGHYEREG